MKRPFWLLLLVLLGCDGGPGGPSMGSLRVTVVGLPGGSSAAVTVTGPGGFNQPVTGTQTIPGLTPGTYTIAAGSVTVGASDYSPSPVTQTVAVNGSQSSVSVLYSTAGGNLAITINGLGTTGSAAVSVTGPNGYAQSVGSTTTLTGLTPGSYLITASDAQAAGGTMHSPSPASQNADVVARATVSDTVTYSPPPSDGTVNLHVAGFYLTQSAQNYSGAIPLVKNRNGLLRVFLVADKANTAAPFVRVRFFNTLGVQVDSNLINPPALSTPTVVDESSLTYSWNLPVSGTRIQPGFGIQIVVDPDGLVGETDEADNVFPAIGPQLMTVRTMPPLNITFVPIVQSGRVGNTSNTDSLLSYTRRMHPLDAINVAVRTSYITSEALLSDGTGWQNVLSELDALRLQAADGRYYYGVANVNYTSGVAGVAYVTTGSSGPQRTAMGWDLLPSGSIVVAHELGHNWTRNHAPCGGPAMIDPGYPRADGSTGGYGWDASTGNLRSATSADVMSYCDPRWISDYTYGAVLNYLSPPAPVVMSQSAVQPCLLVWGHIRDGEMVLEPAFQVSTRPSLPGRAGPYSIEARAGDGTSLFALSFAPHEVADVSGSQQNFAFAIPLPAAKAARLSSLRLSGQGRQAVAQVEAGVQPDSVQLTRVPGGRLGLRWNVKAHPMVMVRDAETGQVLSFARGGKVELPNSKQQVDLIMSNGVKSRIKRVRVGR
jgi:reprolysin-like metallo-peptidase family M12B